MPRKQKKYHYIYKTTNILNNKFYIGMHSTDNLDDGYLGSGKRLRCSINKHGKQNHVCEILEHLSDREALVIREAEIINEDLLQDSLSMNLIVGGSGGWGHFIGTTNVKDKDGNCFNVSLDDSRYLSGELVGVNKGTVTIRDTTGNCFNIPLNDPRYLSGELISITTGRIQTEETKRKLSKIIKEHWKKNKHSWTGKKHSNETKQKMSESSKGMQTGSKNSQYGTIWIHNKKTQQNKKILKDDTIPVGWKKGRKMRF